MANEPKHRGQPTRYDAAVHVPWARSLARRGCSNEEIAEAFGVSIRTLYNWRRAHREFLQALTEAKSRADEEIAESLYLRAVGKAKKVTERQREQLDSNGRKVTLRERTVETLPPDNAAMIFWLKNRQPSLWRDNPDSGQEAASDAAIKGFIAALGLK